jgi:hypothetical protein
MKFHFQQISAGYHWQPTNWFGRNLHLHAQYSLLQSYIGFSSHGMPGDNHALIFPAGFKNTYATPTLISQPIYCNIYIAISILQYLFCNIYFAISISQYSYYKSDFLNTRINISPSKPCIDMVDIDV